MTLFKRALKASQNKLLLTSVLFCSLMIVGCQAELREPPCEAGQGKLPESVLGDYEIVTSNGSAEYGNAQVPDPSLVRIRQSEQGIEIVEAGSNLKNPSQNGSVASPSVVRVCSQGREFYLAMRNENGQTWNLNRLGIFNTGFTIVPITFSPEILRANNVPYFVIPQRSLSDLGNSYSSSYSSRLIVDNRSLKQGEVFRLSRPLSAAIVFNRISDARSKKLNLNMKNVRIRTLKVE